MRIRTSSDSERRGLSRNQQRLGHPDPQPHRTSSPCRGSRRPRQQPDCSARADCGGGSSGTESEADSHVGNHPVFALQHFAIRHRYGQWAASRPVTYELHLGDAGLNSLIIYGICGRGALYSRGAAIAAARGQESASDRPWFVPEPTLSFPGAPVQPAPITADNIDYRK